MRVLKLLWSMYGRKTKIIIVLLTILSAKIFLLTSCVRCPPNQPPIAVLKANPLSGMSPLDVIFDISGSSDPDGIIISYSLDFGDGTEPATGTDITQPITHTYTTAGSFTATLTVTDNYGATGTDSVTITVTAPPPNQPPTATITSPADGSSFIQGDAIEFTGSAIDPEDGALTGASLVWTSSIDGQIGTGESFTRSDLSVGTHTITLVATDSQGAQGTDSVMITVRAPVARTWYVDDDFRDCPNADFNRIQDAIDAASPGDTIMVCPGTYKESLFITKSLILKGAGYEKTVIQTGEKETAIRIWRSFYETSIEVTVESLKAVGSIAGIGITHNVRATIRDNWLFGEGDGIAILGAQAVIEGNYRIGGAYNEGISVSGSGAKAIIRNNRWIGGGSGGITVGDGAEAIIEGNDEIRGFYGSGIVVNGLGLATIEKNTISQGYGRGVTVIGKATIQGNSIINNLDTGIGVLFGGQATILNNSISGSRGGISVRHSAKATIQGNTVWENGAGITVWDSAQAIILGNQISGNGRGIAIWDSAQATISGNTISWNRETGIFILGLAQANIEENKVTGNAGYGVALYQRPCYDTDHIFEGAVKGRSNEILGNEKGEVCPSPELNFLMTEEGGCYGPKC